MDILEKLTKHFGYDPLSKIDPNTQDIKHIEGQADLHRFSQAAIPVILTGLHKFTSTDEGAEEILYPNNSTNWVSKIFAGETPEIIKRVNDYSGFDQAGTENKLNDIAAKAVMFIREAVAPASKPIDVKALLEAQINHILSYLPPSLHMGDILKDNALDDRTHKMEGPISSLVQAIGSGFSKADEDKKKI
ncbi:MAG: hypothetical protein H7X88_04490 [Gloeobacteraceae cyanobacterium ES-bin-316]|nr:hypothetical protein [Ferruginibacter sp.]